MTGTASAEVQLLSLAIQKLETALQRVDASMAEAKCQFTISRLEWLDDQVEIKSTAVRMAREELLDGTLRNNRGTVRFSNFYSMYLYQRLLKKSLLVPKLIE